MQQQSRAVLLGKLQQRLLESLAVEVECFGFERSGVAEIAKQIVREATGRRVRGRTDALQVGVPDHAKEPGPPGRRVADLPPLGLECEKRLLHKILGVGLRARQAPRVPVEFGVMPFDQPAQLGQIRGHACHSAHRSKDAGGGLIIPGSLTNTVPQPRPGGQRPPQCLPQAGPDSLDPPLW